MLVPQRMTAAQERDLVPPLVRRLLDREGKRRTPASDAHLAKRAEELASLHLDPQLESPVRPASVRWVSNQSSRWGSCTLETREIRLSDRLAELPSWVTDYVLVHELAHLAESGHTPRFWSLVAGYPMAERARGFLEGYALRANWSQPEADDLP